MKDKLLCRYSVVNTSTGIPLAFGEKWKRVENVCRDYINSGETFRLFPKLWQKITLYYRNVEICGVRCVIFLWVNNRVRRGDTFNCINCYGARVGLRGKVFYDSLCMPTVEVCRSLISELGIVGAGVI